jgi:hypothetical protein
VSHRAGTTLGNVTAAAAGPVGPDGLPFADASPAQIRDALTPEDAVAFDRHWRTLMRRATERLDLTELHEALEAWRQVAWVTSIHGPDVYRETMASARARLQAGDRGAGAVPWASSRPSSGSPSDAPPVAPIVSYSMDIDPRAQATITALPAAALPALAEAIAVLELVPRSGRSVNPELNPDSPIPGGPGRPGRRLPAATDQAVRQVGWPLRDRLSDCGGEVARRRAGRRRCRVRVTGSSPAGASTPSSVED